jgi:TRAP-type C4-dicarboxylate transport system permease small subunit
MRRKLFPLYRGCGVLAALFLVGIAVLLLAQIVGRLFGILVPSANELAGFSMAAATFLALADTLGSGGHIRVSLVIQRLGGRVRRAVELWCLAVGTLLIGYFTAYAIVMVWESYDFGDVSPGLLPVPLWIPQLGMAVGLLAMAMIFLEELVHVWRGGVPVYEESGETFTAME